MTGPPPLQGIKVLEFAGLAPGPFAGMLLADAGASVLRLDRAPPAGAKDTPTTDMLARRKASIAVDLKSPGGVALVRRLAKAADVVIDPFRPGVLEKLGLGPDDLIKGNSHEGGNPGLVFARMTGFRREGRYAAMAGHDINYLAVSGALGLLGRDGEKPHPPWNILADFAGGGAVLAQGVLLALLARGRSGRGQVVEANMVDGSAYLATFPRMALKTPMGDRPRGQNMLDGGSPWYDTYETADGRYMSVGALEPHFFVELLHGLGLDGQGWEKRRLDRAEWPELRRRIEAVFRSRTRAHWETVFDGTDACCTPVLDFAELEAGSGEGSASGRREGDMRPIVSLRETPCRAVSDAAPPADASPGATGQGTGVDGGGYYPLAIAPGEGGAEALQNWFGWEAGKDYQEKNGVLELSSGNKSKL